MDNKTLIAEDEDINLEIGKKLTILERMVSKCDNQMLPMAISIQGDLSYYLYEKHMPQEDYFEYKTQLSSIVKTFLKKCNCNK